jgi:formyl-CoA transferase
MGKPELGRDERYDVNPKRVARHAEIKQIIEEWTMTMTGEKVLAKFLENGVPSAPINDLAQVVDDEHAKAREMFVEVEHPVAGKTKLNGPSIKMSETMPKVRKPAPTLGQHNYEVYKELLGLNEKEIDTLKSEGII